LFCALFLCNIVSLLFLHLFFPLPLLLDIATPLCYCSFTLLLILGYPFALLYYCFLVVSSTLLLVLRYSFALLYYCFLVVLSTTCTMPIIHCVYCHCFFSLFLFRVFS
jgi:hypothetical protein